ncbi:MAG: TetR/AcrR family transcriptional regulator [Flavobacteriales bacterium]|jgi:AcrR family transcriptional regulator
MKKTISRREKVLRTALQLVANGGFQGAPIAELAAKSKVAVGTIYHHFSNKEDIISALNEMTKENMSNALKGVINPKAIALKNLEVMFMELNQFFVKNPLEFAFLDQFQASPANDSKLAATIFSKEVLDIFRDGQKSGKLRKLPVEALAEYFFNAALTSARMQLVTQKKKISKKEIEGLAEMTIVALKK